MDFIKDGKVTMNQSGKKIAKKNNSLPELNFSEQRLIAQPVVEHDYLKTIVKHFLQTHSNHMK